MSGLSDEDIRAAAAEAGISPTELRQALGKHDALVKVPATGTTSLAVPSSLRGAVVLHAQANIPSPPTEAVRSVRASIESQIGERGHMQDSAEAGIYDQPRGVIYRVRAQDDGRGGALVQVDIDASPAKGKRALVTVGLGAVVAVVGMGGLLFGSFTMLAITAGLGALGVMGLVAGARANKVVYDQAHAIASHALIEAEERATG